FAWTKADSALEVSGLPADAPLKVTLRIKFVGPSQWLAVTSPQGERRELVVSSGATSSPPQTFRSDREGRLSIRLAAHPFRPIDQGHSNDERALGIAFSGVEVTTE